MSIAWRQLDRYDNGDMSIDRADAPLRQIRLLRVTADECVSARDEAAVEEPLQLVIGGAPFAVIMRTPGADEALAAGFLVGERIVRERREVVSIAPAHGRDRRVLHNVVNIELTDTAMKRLARAKRSVAMSASCGLCGRQTIEAIAEEGLRVESAIEIDAAVVAALPDRLRAAQTVFARTGGLHAAGLFRADGTLDAIAEDVGRHNAVDKTIGATWLAQGSLRGHALCVSGRASYEIVLKAVVAGIGVIVAVSAPSTMAIDLAASAGVTLSGFVREGRLNVYTHPGRIRAVAGARHAR
jgi:FdhD protein